MTNPLKAIVAMLLLGAPVLSLTAAEEAQSARNTAIFVTNRAGAAYDGQVPVLEDLLSAKLSDAGFSLMSREMVVNAAGRLDPNNANSGDVLSGQLEDQSTAVRLAQSMGADYILSASIASISKQKRNVNAYGVQLANYTYTLRVSYKVLDASGGGSLTGGVATATKTEQNTVHSNQGFTVVPPDPSTPAAAPGSEAANADEALMKAAQKYQQAVGVVLTQVDGGTSFGTAWGVGPHTFATNAHVAGPAAEALAAGRSSVVVINKHPELRFKVVKAVSHPRYGGSERGMPSNDVGILEVDGQIPSWFPVAPAAELQRIDSGYRVAYLGFPVGENMTAVDPNSPVATMQTGIVTSVTDFNGGVGTSASRLLVQHNLSSTGGASGSPVFNAKGQVVALHNAGNYAFGVVTQGGKSVEQRLKSGLQISYAQRADLLGDIYQYSASAAPGTQAAATKKTTVAVAFLDPDMEPVLADLMDDVTTQIASALRAKVAQNRIAAPKAKAAPVNITLKVETADLYVPDVQIGPGNTVSVQDGKLAVAPLDVTVEIDGVAVGSAPGTVQVKPGLSKLRLTRTGYKTWERTINAVEGQTITVAMQMTPEGLARWQELTAFINALKDQAKLTDAQVEVLKGQAQMLRQSGYKVDTKDAPQITNKSIF
ncbi:MAG: trypsin-like peptidase domain-containing protein [Opitutaceae bacterium]|nr:trypsin-like peptidase domain-containing protein [Opitutaceae bacterium]